MFGHQTFIGTVVRTSENVAKVRVERYPMHPTEFKRVFNIKNFDCYNGLPRASLGDIVRINYTGYLSPTVYFGVKDILEPAPRVETPAPGQCPNYVRENLTLGQMRFGGQPYVFRIQDIPRPPPRRAGNRCRKHAFAVGEMLANFGRLIHR